jgi:predicted nicotinamide N-methyase
MPSSKVRIISHLYHILRFLQKSPPHDLVLSVSLTGLYLWPGAERLCRFAAYHPHLFAQKRVIELGAGAGLGSAVRITPSS